MEGTSIIQIYVVSPQGKLKKRSGERIYGRHFNGSNPRQLTARKIKKTKWRGDSNTKTVKALTNYTYPQGKLKIE